jgi:hypothetical protein
MHLDRDRQLAGADFEIESVVAFNAVADQQFESVCPDAGRARFEFEELCPMARSARSTAAALAVVEDASGTMTSSKAPLASAWRASGRLYRRRRAADFEKAAPARGAHCSDLLEGCPRSR